MKRLLSFPDVRDRIDWIGTPEQQCQMLRRYYLDGYEVIWCDQEVEKRFPREQVIGMHLPFFADWMNFWLEDHTCLDREFGDRITWQNFYQGKTKESYIEYLGRALDYAHSLNVEYVIFHVSQVSVDEAFDYRFQFDDAAVLRESVKVINTLLAPSNQNRMTTGCGNQYNFYFLMENLWWPGLNFRDASMTRDLLNAIHYDRKGLALDLGHLLNANTSIRTKEDAILWIQHVLNEHDDMLPYMKAVHLHQSMTGAFVEQFCASNVTKQANELLIATHTKENRMTLDYYDRYRLSYEHVAKIDEHAVWEIPGLHPILKRISPDYLVYEFRAKTREEFFLNLERQNSYFGF